MMGDASASLFENFFAPVKTNLLANLLDVQNIHIWAALRMRTVPNVLTDQHEVEKARQTKRRLSSATELDLTIRG
jgi:hypothetical protein